MACGYSPVVINAVTDSVMCPRTGLVQFYDTPTSSWASVSRRDRFRKNQCRSDFSRKIPSSVANLSRNFSPKTRPRGEPNRKVARAAAAADAKSSSYRTTNFCVDRPPDRRGIAAVSQKLQRYPQVRKKRGGRTGQRASAGRATGAQIGFPSAPGPLPGLSGGMIEPVGVGRAAYEVVSSPAACVAANAGDGLRHGKYCRGRCLHRKY